MRTSRVRKAAGAHCVTLPHMIHGFLSARRVIHRVLCFICSRKRPSRLSVLNLEVRMVVGLGEGGWMHCHHKEQMNIKSHSSFLALSVFFSASPPSLKATFAKR